MNTQNQNAQPVLPTRISLPRATHPVVRFGEGYIAPKIALHHARELNRNARSDDSSRRA